MYRFVKSFDPEGRYAGVFMDGSWAVCDLVEERLVGNWPLKLENIAASPFLGYDPRRNRVYQGFCATWLTCYDGGTGRQLWRNTRSSDSTAGLRIHPRTGDLLMGPVRLSHEDGKRVRRWTPPNKAVDWLLVPHPAQPIELHVVCGEAFAATRRRRKALALMHEETGEVVLPKKQGEASHACFDEEHAYVHCPGQGIYKFKLTTGECIWERLRNRKEEEAGVTQMMIHRPTGQLRIFTRDCPPEGMDPATGLMTGNGLLMLDAGTSHTLAHKLIRFPLGGGSPGACLVLGGDRILMYDGRLLDAGTLEVVKENVWQQMGVEVPIS